MNYYKLAAEIIDDEEDTAPSRSDKAKKILYTLAALGGVGALGGLAYKNWDTIKDKLSFSTKPNVAQNAASAALNPWGHAAAAAVLPPMASERHLWGKNFGKSKASTQTIGQLNSALPNIPETSPTDAAETSRTFWNGAPLNQERLDAAKNLRDPHVLQSLHDQALSGADLPLKDAHRELGDAIAARNAGATTPAQDDVLQRFSHGYKAPTATDPGAVGSADVTHQSMGHMLRPSRIGGGIPSHLVRAGGRAATVGATSAILQALLRGSDTTAPTMEKLTGTK